MYKIIESLRYWHFRNKFKKEIRNVVYKTEIDMKNIELTIDKYYKKISIKRSNSYNVSLKLKRDSSIILKQSINKDTFFIDNKIKLKLKYKTKINKEIYDIFGPLLNILFLNEDRCYYCDYDVKIKNIIKLSEEEDNIFKNIIVTCDTCLIIRNNDDHDVFLLKCEHITKYNTIDIINIDRIYNKPIRNEDKSLYRRNFHLFNDSQSCILDNFYINKMLEKYCIDKYQYNKLQLRCLVCKKINKSKKTLFIRSVDKSNPNIMDIFGCCYTCNNMLVNFDLNFFLNYCKRITMINKNLSYELKEYSFIEL